MIKVAIVPSSPLSQYHVTLQSERTIIPTNKEFAFSCVLPLWHTSDFADIMKETKHHYDNSKHLN